VGQRRLLSIVLGAASENARANESQKLLNWGYTAFDAVKLFDVPGSPMEDAPHCGKAQPKQRSRLGREGRHCGGRARGQQRASSARALIARPDPLIGPVHQGPVRSAR
jgi:D-alanyl-D-alanine carboxypeptidase (penicillin-binding protein 5/6)